MVNNNQEMQHTKQFKDKAEKLCKHIEIVPSFQTDGKKVILQYIEIVTLKLVGSREKAEERIERDDITMLKLIKWRDKGKAQGKISTSVRSVGYCNRSV